MKSTCFIIVVITVLLLSYQATAAADMHPRTDSYFMRLFGFAEGEYQYTREKLLAMCHFERCGPRERCRFTNSTTQLQLDSGWHSSPTIAQLRAELTKSIGCFNKQFPGYMDGLVPERLVRDGVDPNAPTTVFDDVKSPAQKFLPLAHVIGSSGDQHVQFPNAMFQAASQFNLLEFISSSVTPEAGISGYLYDKTQGPECAVACMAATAYRNYLMHPDFVERGHLTDCKEEQSDVSHQRGQNSANQTEMLRDLTLRLTAAEGPLPALDYTHFFTIRNGYFSSGRMEDLPARLEAMAAHAHTSVDAVLDELSDLLRIGVVSGATVTYPFLEEQATSSVPLHTVAQTFNSALSLYGHFDYDSPTAVLARCVLDGSYEGTLLAGALHTLRYLLPFAKAGKYPESLPPVFLTKVGGGVFNNDHRWIREAIGRAVKRVNAHGVPIDVRLVHFRDIDWSYI